MSQAQRDLVERNYHRVIDRAAAAAARRDRSEDSWRLVAVTKTVSPETAAALAAIGVRDLGENRVNELTSKLRALGGLDVRWHMIGHLQRNKVKKVVGHVDFIHSVDSERLAAEIERVAAPLEVVQKVLLEVNVSGEGSKYGIAPEEAQRLAESLASMKYVALRGLMTMAPIVDDAEKTRPLFAALRDLGLMMAQAGLFGRSDFELSMGMTQDFEVAIEEGATMIRVGSALFEGL